MTLQAAVALRREGFDLKVELAADKGEVVAVVGPNGAGKTTLLRAIAGLERIAAGRVQIDDRVVVDTTGGVDVPPAQRRVGMVFQDPLLFPHMTVRANVAFSGGEAADQWLERLDLSHLADRMPPTLSGGEAQRAALARALASDPRVLLLDEPLAALDVETRQETRAELARHLAHVEVPVLLVTHDPLDAALLAERIVVLEAGAVTHVGTLAELTRRPRTSWVARLVGVNLYRGAGQGPVVAVGDTEISVADHVRGPVFALVPPTAVALYRRPPAGSPRNLYPGSVTRVEPAGSRVRVSIDGPLPIVAEVTPAAVEELRLAEAGQVWASVKAAEVTTYPAGYPAGD